MPCDHRNVTVFACGRCETVVTIDLVEVPFSDNIEVHDERTDALPRVRRGTFALDPEPFGPPLEPLADHSRIVGAAGPRGTILVHPADVRGLRRHPDLRRLNGCCRLDGLDGPNLVYGHCGNEVATEQSDCWVSWHDLRLQPDAVTAAEQRRR